MCPDLQISGDVGLETGHVEFDGHIEILGIVKTGYRVSGKSLTARAIEKAEIKIDGDIIVQQGIIGASVKTGGKLRAGHIRISNIEALGDVIVEEEIVDSEIDNNCACIFERGRVLSSRVAAKKGINSVAIGSDQSNPCTLIVGVDTQLKKTIEKIKNQITETKKAGINLKSQVNELQQETNKVDNTIEKITGEEEKALAQQVVFKNKIEELQKNPDSKLAAKAEEAVKQLDKKINQIRQTVVKLFDAQEQIADKIAGHQNEIKSTENAVDQLYSEIESHSEASKIDKGISVVKVSGMIAARTVITGPCASLTCQENYQHVRIYETKFTEEDSSTRWNMNVSAL